MANYTEAKKRNNRAWDSNNLDRLSFTLPKGQKATVKAAADKAGESTTSTRKGLYWPVWGCRNGPSWKKKSRKKIDSR